MANTQFRTQCPKCAANGKDTHCNNLCWFKNDKTGVLTNKCELHGRILDSRIANTLDKEQYKTQNSADMRPLLPLIEDGIYEAIPERFITEETCRKYLYQIATISGQKCHIANYCATNGHIVSQKVRRVCDKTFSWRQNNDNKQLFGVGAIYDYTTLYLCEGELDCLTLGQLGYQAASISTGAGGQTAGEIKKHLKWLDKFDKIVLVFDNDEVGQSTTREVLPLLPIGKAWHVTLREYKDPNEYLMNNAVAPLIAELSAAQQYKPESIRKPSIDDLMIEDPMGRELPFPILNKMIRGIKPERLYIILAEPKAGKSFFTKIAAKHLIDSDQTLQLGLAYLEEPLKQTAQSFIALDNDQPDYMISEQPNCVSYEAFKESYDKYVGSNRIHYIDADKADLSSNNFIKELEFLIYGMKCEIVVLDHLQMIESDVGGDSGERKGLETLVRNLKKLARKAKCAIITISHIGRSSKDITEDNARVLKAADGFGSGVYERFCDVILALERNQLNPEQSKKLKVKVCANRITGKCGYADELYWNETKGRYELLGELFQEE